MRAPPAVGLFALASASLLAAACATASGPEPLAKAPPTSAPVVARVNGEPLDEQQVARHAFSTGLSREVAVEDLIDFTLVREAAPKAGITTPEGPWSRDDRIRVELLLARALSLDIPPSTDTLTVDHAWIKDVANPKLRAANRAQLEKIRALAASGAYTIPLAYQKVVKNGSAWHIGDHEEYPYEVIPTGARDLPWGSYSEVLPGDGGLHLFRIHARRKADPPPLEVRSKLSAHLRPQATIERPKREP